MSPFRRMLDYLIRKASPAYERTRVVSVTKLSDPRTLENRNESRCYRARGGLR